MSDKSANANSASIAAAAPQPVPATAPNEQPSGGNPPVKEPEADQGEAKVTEPTYGQK